MKTLFLVFVLCALVAASGPPTLEQNGNNPNKKKTGPAPLPSTRQKYQKIPIPKPQKTTVIVQDQPGKFQVYSQRTSEAFNSSANDKAGDQVQRGIGREKTALVSQENARGHQSSQSNNPSNSSKQKTNIQDFLPYIQSFRPKPVVQKPPNITRNDSNAPPLSMPKNSSSIRETRTNTTLVTQRIIPRQQPTRQLVQNNAITPTTLNGSNPHTRAIVSRDVGRTERPIDKIPEYKVLAQEHYDNKKHYKTYAERPSNKKHPAPRYFHEFISNRKLGCHATHSQTFKPEYAYSVKGVGLGVALYADRAPLKDLGHNRSRYDQRNAYAYNGIQLDEVERLLLEKGAIVIRLNYQANLVIYHTFIEGPFQVIIVKRDRVRVVPINTDRTRNQGINVSNNRSGDVTDEYENIIWGATKHRVEEGDKVVILPRWLIEKIDHNEAVRAGQDSVKALLGYLLYTRNKMNPPCTRDQSNQFDLGRPLSDYKLEPGIIVAEVKDSVIRPPPRQRNEVIPNHALNNTNSNETRRPSAVVDNDRPLQTGHPKTTPQKNIQPMGSVRNGHNDRDSRRVQSLMKRKQIQSDEADSNDSESEDTTEVVERIIANKRSTSESEDANESKDTSELEDTNTLVDEIIAELNNFVYEKK